MKQLMLFSLGQSPKPWPLLHTHSKQSFIAYRICDFSGLKASNTQRREKAMERVAADLKLWKGFSEEAMERVTIVGLLCALPNSNLWSSFREAIHVLDYQSSIACSPVRDVCCNVLVPNTRSKYALLFGGNALDCVRNQI